MKRRQIITAQALAAIMLAAVSIYMFISKTTQAREKSESEHLSNTYATVRVQTEDETIPLADLPHAPGGAGQSNEQPRLIVDFDALQELNSDIAGWIYIEGTPINHPFVQTTDNDYYLSKSFTGEQSKLGTIFLDCELSEKTSDMLILYGHNMGKDRDEMFSPLSSYDNSEFLHRHNEIVTSAPDGRETVWQIFAVLHISTNTDASALYRKHGFLNEQEYNEFIELIKSMHMFDTGITPVSKQRILMLSTCLGDTFGLRRSDMRRIVFAVEVF